MEKKKMTTNAKFIILAIVCIILFGIAVSPISLQNDTFYTIKIGENILQNGLAQPDPFSWHGNLPYTYPHWLYDVIVYLIYHIGGMTGIYVSTVVLACVLGIVVFATNSKLSKNTLTSFVLTIGVMFLFKDYIAARAQLVTFILFALTIYFIERFLCTKKKHYAVGLIVIPTLIANLHIAVWPFYFVLYLPYVAEYLLCLLLDNKIYERLRRKRLERKLSKCEGNTEKQIEIQQEIQKFEEYMRSEKEKKQKRRENPYKIKIEKVDATKWLILIMLICGLTGLLTPLGDAPYTYLIKTMEGTTTKNISEHLPLTLFNDKNFMCVITIFLAILIFTDVKIRLRDLFMIGGLLFLSFMTRRQTSMFILIGVIPLNRMICDLFDKYDKEGCDKFKELMVTGCGKIITVSIVLILCLFLIKPKIHNSFINESNYPVKAAEYIKNNLDYKNIKLYNEYNYGSYLLFQDIPVFIDSRADLYAPEFNGGKDVFSDFINVSNINTYYEDKFKEYGITHVICYKNAKLNMFLSRDSNYKLLYSDDSFCVYERLSR